MRLTFSECDLKVLLEGSVSEIFYLGLSFDFIPFILEQYCTVELTLGLFKMCECN